MVQDIPKEVIEFYVNYPEKTDFVPVALNNGTLRVWISHESARCKADYFGFVLGYDVEVELKEKREVLEACERLYEQLGETEEGEFQEQEELFDEENILSSSYTDAPIVNLVNHVIIKAIQRKASDIHFEGLDNRFVVRLRVDGVLMDFKSYPKRIQEPVISRIKVMANLDVADTRRPQDGVIRVNVGAKTYDMRVSTMPSISGEKAVLRILYGSQEARELSDLGLDDKGMKLLLEKARYPNGIILVTGPTGSGKTTTLYAVLKRIATRDKNVLTIEDPVEYRLDGITQVQVNPAVGLTFSSALRYFLRQDPDVILVGEIRDVETARMAISASLTGHLVLSTLHTNDAATTITRLIDMGIEPFLLASSLVLVVGQRLVRKNCPRCSRTVPVSEELREVLLGYGVELDSYMKGQGCDFCKGTGFWGRVGIFELLPVDERIKRLIIKKADSDTIKAAAIEGGMCPLFEDGMRKVRLGITTPEEVLLATRL